MMTKLWQKEYQFDQLIEEFTVGNDPILDSKLIVYDCVGSIAHAHMLKSIGILSAEEFIILKKSLKEIIKLAQGGNFLIKKSDEDVHTAIERYLINNIGDLGKKIHTARSRNDQIALDLRLYMRDELFKIVSECLLFANELLDLVNKTKEIPIPGRTHFQPAMPSSFGLFFGSYAESLLDNISLLQNSFKFINQSPLGSAAGYGVNISIDRNEVATVLGFEKAQNNVLYVSNSRGKIESIVLHALTQIMVDLSRLSSDLIIFSAPEFGYIEIPKELCSGSSLMPQKRNPDCLELVRAKSSTVISDMLQTIMITRGLPSGYNRDLQETKESLMNGFTTTFNSISICKLTISKLKINKDKCINSFTKELYATDCVLKLVQQGVPFREAYKKIASDLNSLEVEDPVSNIKNKTHVGATGNLGLDKSYKQSADYMQWVEYEQSKYKKALDKLLMKE